MTIPRGSEVAKNPDKGSVPHIRIFSALLFGVAVFLVIWLLDTLIGDVATTQIYTHVMQRPGIGVRSPLDG